MRSFPTGRVASFAPILLTALVSSGCPELNRQPDYLGDRTAFLSIPDPLPTSSLDVVDGASATSSNDQSGLESL